MVYYQPIVKLIGIPNDCPPTVVGAEALLRWNHESNGVLLPSEFLPVLEASPSLMDKVEGNVLSAAATKAVAAHLKVSVNVSPLQLFYGDLVKTVERVLTRSCCPPTLFILEITEQLAIDDFTPTAKVLMRFSVLGVQIVADDFDTGCSSLAWLYQLPHDGIKLDRTFLAHLPGQYGRSGGHRHHRPGTPSGNPRHHRGCRIRPRGEGRARDGLRLRPGLFLRPARTTVSLNR